MVHATRHARCADLGELERLDAARAQLGEDEAAPSEDKTLEVLTPLRPRYFTPREVARLHGFPETFAFPDAISQKKRYELLGNSLSVQVVAGLLRYLMGVGALVEAADAEAAGASSVGVE